MVSLRKSAVLCVNLCGVYAAEQGSLAQKSTGGASSAVKLARETIPPRKLRGMQLPPRWGQLGGLAADEGNQLGEVAFLALPSECMAHCDANSNCNSVTYCHEWGGCFLKDRLFTGNESTSSNSDCSTYYKINGTTPVPRKKKCLKLGDMLPPPWKFEREYDPETEQCCGEGVYGTPTVCSKDMGCCASGGTSGTARCFDRSSQQCCGTVSEMPVVCGLVGCPSSSFPWQCPAEDAAANSSGSDEVSNQMLPHWDQLGGLAADEGNQLGDVAFLALPRECMAHCDADSDCNSVAYCHEWGGCFLKDQVLTGNEATSSNHDCSTYYRIKGTTTTTSMLPHWNQLGGLAADEGNQLGDVAFLALPSECMAHCDADSVCNSVAYCHEWGGCFLKDRVFTGNEATSSNRDCSTYYRINSSGSDEKIWLP